MEEYTEEEILAGARADVVLPMGLVSGLLFYCNEYAMLHMEIHPDPNCKSMIALGDIVVDVMHLANQAAELAVAAHRGTDIGTMLLAKGLLDPPTD